MSRKTILIMGLLVTMLFAISCVAPSAPDGAMSGGAASDTAAVSDTPSIVTRESWSMTIGEAARGLCCGRRGCWTCEEPFMILIPREELRATIDNWVSNQSFSRPVEVVTELQPGESADIVILTKDYWTAIPDTQKEFDTSKIVSNDFFTIIVPDSELSNDAKSLIDVLPAITIPPLSEGEAPPIDLNRDTGCWRQEGECCTLYLCDACAKICPALAEPITEETPVRIVVPGEENRLIVEAWMAQQSITGAIIVSELQPGEYADISIFTNESWLSIPDEQKSGDNTINLSDNDFTIVAPDTKHNELATNLLQVLPQLTVPDDTN